MKYWIFCLTLLPVFHVDLLSQTKPEYPDSLKTAVLKIDPFALLNAHVSMGFELALKKNKFADFMVGVPFSGGFLFKGGVKLPVRYTTPFSILYLMPEVAFSQHRLINYFDYSANGPTNKSVRSAAILLSFGYRHVNPRTKFYYDIGIGYGIGFANISVGGNLNNYNHTLAVSNSNYSNYNYNSTPKTSTSGLATSGHATIGFILKKKKK